MLTFDKLITVTGNKYSIRSDTISDIRTLFNNISDTNTTIVVVVIYGTIVYALDLSKLVTNYPTLLNSANIQTLIGKLTPLMLFSYTTPMFSQSRYIRSIMTRDLPGTVTVSPYSIQNGGTIDSTYDLSYPDMLISCTKYNLNMMLPIVNGKLRMCRWNRLGQIMLPDRVDLVRTTKDVTYLSFGDTTITLQSLSNLSSANWVVPQNSTILLVLAGSLFYNDPNTFTITQTGVSQLSLKLNQQSIMKLFTTKGYENINLVTSDPDSFIIILPDRVLVRDIVMTGVNPDAEVLQFVYYENQDHDHHLDYICLDNLDNTVHGLTTANEKYVDVYNMIPPEEHNIYIDGGSGDMRLIQMALC